MTFESMCRSFSYTREVSKFTNTKGDVAYTVYFTCESNINFNDREEWVRQWGDINKKISDYIKDINMNVSFGKVSCDIYQIINQFEG